MRPASLTNIQFICETQLSRDIRPRHRSQRFVCGIFGASARFVRPQRTEQSEEKCAKGNRKKMANYVRYMDFQWHYVDLMQKNCSYVYGVSRRQWTERLFEHKLPDICWTMSAMATRMEKKVFVQLHSTRIDRQRELDSSVLEMNPTSSKHFTVPNPHYKIPQANK